VCSAITDTPYAVIVIAAFLPAILYYFGLLVQVDSYAARVGLRGVRPEDIPNIWKTLKEGWPFILVLAFLVFGLIYMRWGVAAPIYAAGLMFFLPFFLSFLSLFLPFFLPSRRMMMTPRRFVEALVTIGGLIVLITAIMLCVGFILIGVQAPGSFVALTTWLMGGGQALATILLIAVAVCYIFGMIGVAMPIYIVLAVTFVPTLVTATGLNFLAVHLFLIYYGRKCSYEDWLYLYASGHSVIVSSLLLSIQSFLNSTRHNFKDDLSLCPVPSGDMDSRLRAGGLST
jgi:TRAP-type uncharacterized transport system fused permease subunit